MGWKWGMKAVPDRLNIDTKDEMEVTGYRRDTVKFCLTVVLTVLTGGLLLLLITWRPSIKLTLTYKRCSLQSAHRLLLKDLHQQLWEEELVEEVVSDVSAKTPKRRLYFINKKIKYIWDDNTCTFIRLRPLQHGSTFNTLQKQDCGLSTAEASERLALYGTNFMQIDILSVWQLIVQQAYNPFYIFQAYTVILWSLQLYLMYAGCVAAFSVISITLNVYETRKQSRALRKTVTSQSDVTVLRDGQRANISSCDVVPGDVILLDNDVGRLEVDAVLLQGSVIINEAMLTGESIPITKVSMPKNSDVMFSEEEHKNHLLYSGTEVLQIRGSKELPALVVRTGFYTSRGELVRSILFPKPVDFHFYNDFLKMLGIFVFLGLLAMTWSLVSWISIGAIWSDILYNSLDLITFVVPPILPATITAINAWAQQRLKKQGIFCLSSKYISLSGSVDVVCFDKTGTLTEDDLALAGILPCAEGTFGQPKETLTDLPLDEPLTRALSACHSLSVINSRLVGYPLDIKIFNGIGWEFQEPPTTVNLDYGIETPVLVQPRPRDGLDCKHFQVAVLKNFPFESREQRMTVITKAMKDSNMEVYMKGAPEKIVSLCNTDTVPGIIDDALEWYTRQGLRVLAVSGKKLPTGTTMEQVELSPREMLEEESVFLGLVVMQNKIKVETPPVLLKLHKAAISTVMVTGDNLLTALSVAQQSGLVTPGQQLIVVKAQMVSASSVAANHLKTFFYDADTDGGLHDKRKLISVRNDNYALAMDGNTFELILRAQDKDLLHRVIHKGKVFARMKPDQKITVVETLQSLGHQVAMCGDGCNDCGALKVADAGISLSSAEASVAAPFTSKQKDISCVPTLIREGRSTLVSIFAAFKYNVIAGFGALICVLFHFYVNTEPTDTQYLIIDLVLITVPALMMGNTGATSYLVSRPPTKRILSFLPSASMVSFLGFQVLTNWWILSYTRAQSWYEPHQYDENHHPQLPSYENTALIIACFYSYVTGTLVCSHGAPYRKPFYTNYILLIYLVVATFFCIFTNFYTGSWLVEFCNFRIFPSAAFNAMIFLIVCINFLVSLMWEQLVLCRLVQNKVLPWIQATCGPHAMYTKLEKQLAGLRDWPPLTEIPQINTDYSSGTDEVTPEERTALLVDKQLDEDDILLMRKLTRRHKFKASVKYVKENSGEPSADLKRLDAYLPNSSGSSTQVYTPFTQPMSRDIRDHSDIQQFQQHASPRSPPDSAGYQVPWDAQQEARGVFSFNRSVRHQIMKGTGGVFRTFRGSTKKKQNVMDETTTAEPYDVIRLSDQSSGNKNTYPEEEIYATIDEETVGKENQTRIEEANFTTTENRQDEENKGLDKVAETNLQEEVRRTTDYFKELDGNYFGKIEMRRKCPREDDDDTSLMKAMDVAWHRISGSPLLPYSMRHEIGVGISSRLSPITTTTEPTSPLGIYDVPRPPRPVHEHTTV